MTKEPKCITCGYTEFDAKHWGDHHLCRNAGGAPWEKKANTKATVTKEPVAQTVEMPCDCWKHENQVCDVCQEVESASEAQPVEPLVTCKECGLPITRYKQLCGAYRKDGGIYCMPLKAQREEEPLPLEACLCDDVGCDLCPIHKTHCIECGQRLVSTPPTGDMPEPLVSEQGFEEWWLAYDEIEQELPSRYESAKAAWNAAKGVK